MALAPRPRSPPIDDHYVVAKGLTPPSIDAFTWRLAVQGLVATPAARGASGWQEVRIIGV